MQTAASSMGSFAEYSLFYRALFAKETYVNADGGIILGSRELTSLSLDLLGDGDSVYTRENLYENLRTTVKTCWMCTGTPVKPGE